MKQRIIYEDRKIDQEQYSRDIFRSQKSVHIVFFLINPGVK
jgi:hypothetical protein